MCSELGLRYHFRLLYRDICYSEINLLTTKKLDLRDPVKEDACHHDFLEEALEDFAPMRQAEGFVFIGQEKPDPTELKEQFVGTFYKEPFTEILEIMEMKSPGCLVLIAQW